MKLSIFVKKAMKITLNIPNIHADFFMQLIKSLNLDIKIEEKDDIPEWHKSILEDRFAQYSNGDKSKFMKWDDIKKGIETELHY
jgi:Putative addiction module component